MVQFGIPQIQQMTKCIYREDVVVDERHAVQLQAGTTRPPRAGPHATVSPGARPGGSPPTKRRRAQAIESVAGTMRDTGYLTGVVGCGVTTIRLYQ